MVSHQGRSRSTRVAQEAFGGETWSELARDLLIGICGEKQGNSKNTRGCVNMKAGNTCTGHRGDLLSCNTVGPLENQQEVHLWNPIFLLEFISVSNYIWPKLILTQFCWPLSIGFRKSRKDVSETDQRKNRKKKMPPTSFLLSNRVDTNPLFAHPNQWLIGFKSYAK